MGGVIWDMVATTSRSTCDGSAPASARALAAAAAPISARVSSGAAKRRVLMPERRSIHSGEESMWRQISALVTRRRGRYTPTPVIVGVKVGAGARTGVFVISAVGVGVGG